MSDPDADVPQEIPIDRFTVYFIIGVLQGVGGKLPTQVARKLFEAVDRAKARARGTRSRRGFLHFIPGEQDYILVQDHEDRAAQFSITFSEVDELKRYKDRLVKRRAAR